MYSIFCVLPMLLIPFQKNEKSPPEKAAVLCHDWFNIGGLGIVSSMWTISKIYDDLQLMFFGVLTMYIIIDLLILIIFPSCVGSCYAIKIHHLMTVSLCCTSVFLTGLYDEPLGCCDNFCSISCRESNESQKIFHAEVADISMAIASVEILTFLRICQKLHLLERTFLVSVALPYAIRFGLHPVCLVRLLRVCSSYHCSTAGFWVIMVSCVNVTFLIAGSYYFKNKLIG